MKSCVIIGGGIIGLSTAYYLIKEGHQVTVIDQSDITSGASFVNAGYITPSHIIPLAAPGMISKGIKWMFDASSPFYVKPRLDSDFLQWSWAFKKSSTRQKVERSIPLIKDINILSRELYQEIKNSGDFEFQFERKGLLMCYKTDEAGEEEWEVGQRGKALGLGVANLTKEEVDLLEPEANLDIKGAVFYDTDAHMTPGQYMKALYSFLKEQGVTFYTNEKVLDIWSQDEKIATVKTDKRRLTADEFIVAAGSWSPTLTKSLGIKIPTQAGKGYRINVERPTGISIPAILLEAKVAVTPMNGFTRFAGTMEIGGINHEINPVRVEAIANAASAYYKGLEVKESEKSGAACGLRPVSPDGLPYIGRTSKYRNLCIASGHAMMGWSLGPATGKLIAEVISGRKTTLDISAYHPDRRF
ncbi:NAD(P)/FAD-dependent oxidoreductase [Aquimarina rhabdastrellae]